MSTDDSTWPRAVFAGVVVQFDDTIRITGWSEDTIRGKLRYVGLAGVVGTLSAATAGSPAALKLWPLDGQDKKLADASHYDRGKLWFSAPDVEGVEIIRRTELTEEPDGSDGLGVPGEER